MVPTEKPGQPSPLRIYMREHFETLMGIKTARGLSWSQMAAILAERGLAKANGSALDGNVVAVMAAHIRMERGPKPVPKRKGRARRRRETPVEPSAPPLHRPPEPVPGAAEPQGPLPEAAPFSTGDPALDRALNSVRKLTPLPPMGKMDTQGRRSLKPTQEKQDDGEDG